MSLNFKFKNLGKDLEINIDANNQALCPNCGSKFQRLLYHLQRNSDCRSFIDNFETFKDEYQLFSNRRRQNVHKQRKLDADPEEFRNDVANRVRNYRERKLEADPEELHRDEAKRARNTRDRKIKDDPEKSMMKIITIFVKPA